MDKSISLWICPTFKQYSLPGKNRCCKQLKACSSCLNRHSNQCLFRNTHKCEHQDANNPHNALLCPDNHQQESATVNVAQGVNEYDNEDSIEDQVSSYMNSQDCDDSETESDSEEAEDPAASVMVSTNKSGSTNIPNFGQLGFITELFLRTHIEDDTDSDGDLQRTTNESNSSEDDETPEQFMERINRAMNNLVIENICEECDTPKSDEITQTIMGQDWENSVLDSETIVSKEVWHQAESKRDTDNVLEEALNKGPFDKILFQSITKVEKHENKDNKLVIMDTDCCVNECASCKNQDKENRFIRSQEILKYSDDNMKRDLFDVVAVGVITNQDLNI